MIETVGPESFHPICSSVSTSGNFAGKSGRRATVLCVAKRSHTTCMNVYTPTLPPTAQMFPMEDRGTREETALARLCYLAFLRSGITEEELEEAIT